MADVIDERRTSSQAEPYLNPDLSAGSPPRNDQIDKSPLHRMAVNAGSPLFFFFFLNFIGNHPLFDPSKMLFYYLKKKRQNNISLMNVFWGGTKRWA